MGIDELSAASCLTEDQAGIPTPPSPLPAARARPHAMPGGPPAAPAQFPRAAAVRDQIAEHRQCRACSDIPRSPNQIDQIVMHTPEGGEGGTLSVLNGDRAGFDFFLPLSGRLYQCNDYLRHVAWQAGHWDTNVRSVGIEQGDFAANSGNFPRAHYERLARLVGELVVVTNTPLRRATRIGEPGIIAHGDVTPASRTDPGRNFRWDLLLELAAQHISGGGSTVAQWQTTNPNIEQQLLEWRAARRQRGEDVNDWQAFREFQINIGAPDPGAREFVDFRS
jgi:N-acetyl-anhydromuramyl-L-alanine amidase AmpD